MTRFLVANTLLLLVAAPVVAGPPPKCKPFNGVSPEQFRHSTVARWADQLVLELAALKTDTAAPRLPAPSAAAIGGRTDRASTAAVALGRAARKPAPRGEPDRHLAGHEGGEA